MPAAVGPRFVLEAGFLVLLAVVVGFADLDPPLIILVMTVGWLLVSLIEYFAWRQTRGFAMNRFEAVARAPAVQEQVVEDVAPPPPPPPAPVSPPTEEETIVQAPAQDEKETVAQADDQARQLPKVIHDRQMTNALLSHGVHQRLNRLVGSTGEHLTGHHGRDR